MHREALQSRSEPPRVGLLDDGGAFGLIIGDWSARSHFLQRCFAAGGDDVAGPFDGEEATRMLARLAGRTHRVHTGVALVCGDERAGDVITTGTPPGVGMGQKPEPQYLKAGDVIELGVEGLGTQKQKVVAFKGKRT